MKRIIPILLVVVMCNSCASILNKNSTKVQIYTSEPTTVILQNDTMETVDNQLSLKLLRSRKHIEMIFLSDSIQKTITLHSSYSTMYYLNFLTNLGYGVIIDRNSKKRFGYPKDIYMDMSNDRPEYIIYNAPRKGEWYVRFSLPFANHFNVIINEELDRQISTGFWGVGGGVDFFYESNRFLSTTVSYSSNFPYAIPYPYQSVLNLSRGSGFDSFRSFYVALSNNHYFDGLSLGYGLTYGEKRWDFHGDIEPSRVDGLIPKYRGEKDRVGLLFSAHIQNGKHFNFGLNYHPTFFDSDNGFWKSNYDHLISLECLWRFRVEK